MNVVNKSEICTIKDMNRINKRGNHCPFGDPFAAPDSSLKFKFLRAEDFFALACSIISGADSGWF